MLLERPPVSKPSVVYSKVVIISLLAGGAAESQQVGPRWEQACMKGEGAFCVFDDRERAPVAMAAQSDAVQSDAASSRPQQLQLARSSSDPRDGAAAPLLTTLFVFASEAHAARAAAHAARVQPYTGTVQLQRTSRQS